MKTYQQYINGAWVAPLNGKYTEVYNPSDDSVVGMVANGDEKDADLALQAAQAAQKSWAKLTARRRAEILYAFIEEIKKNKEELAKMISTEQGKLFKVAQFEVDVCCSFIAYACEWARRIEGDFSVLRRENLRGKIVFRPLGNGDGLRVGCLPGRFARRTSR